MTRGAGGGQRRGSKKTAGGGGGGAGGGEKKRGGGGPPPPPPRRVMTACPALLLDPAGLLQLFFHVLLQLVSALVFLQEEHRLGLVPHRLEHDRDLGLQLL